jgi:hypothetical protein
VIDVAHPEPPAAMQSHGCRALYALAVHVLQSPSDAEQKPNRESATAALLQKVLNMLGRIGDPANNFESAALTVVAGKAAEIKRWFAGQNSVVKVSEHARSIHTPSMVTPVSARV